MPPSSLFEGTDEIISAALDLRPGDSLKHKSVCRRLEHLPKDGPSFERLVPDLYEKIERNWDGRMPSRENWRLERQTAISPRNKSPEVLLERAIAILGTRGILEDWFNQIPVASGLIDGSSDKRAAIDLLRYRDSYAEFVELKWKSDTPAYAAFEILHYGLAYLFSFVNRAQFGYLDKRLMTVSGVSLSVLAPHRYFAPYDLRGLGEQLDERLRAFVRWKSEGELEMDFRFVSFPENFDPPFDRGKQVLELEHLPESAHACQTLVTAVQGLEPVWQRPEPARP